MDQRKPSFLSSLFVSAATGAACGALGGAMNAREEDQKAFTGTMVDLALNLQNNYIHRQKKGYFDPDDPFWRG